jgi:hypothetical protein
MRGHTPEVLIGGQHRKLMMDAELGEECVDGADLHPSPTTAVTQFRSGNVIFPAGTEERQSCEPVDDVPSRTRSGEALQQFL